LIRFLQFPAADQTRQYFARWQSSNIQVEPGNGLNAALSPALI
jgi:hypothetical protein